MIVNTVFAPILDSDCEIEESNGGNLKVPLEVCRDKDGNKCILVFTKKTLMLQQYPEAKRHFEAPLRLFARVAIANGLERIVINPGQLDEFAYLEPAEVRSIADAD
jgi:hypothetical protein